MTDALATIQEFTDLAVRRLKGELATTDRGRIEALEDQLRDMIDGAHPAPRRIENPAPAKTSVPSLGVKPAQINVAPTASKPPRAVPTTADLADDLTIGDPHRVAVRPRPSVINEADRAKLAEVSSTDIPVSSYTPASRPPYLDDYYSEEVSRPNDLSALGGTPARAITADGEATQLMEEVRVLFGVTSKSPPPRSSSTTNRTTEPARPRRPSSTANVTDTEVPMPTMMIPPPAFSLDSARVVPPADPRPDTVGLPAVVHLLSGVSKRGELVELDPSAGSVLLRQGGQEEQIAVNEVFAIFVGVARGTPPTVQSGTRIGVKLSNGKELVGASPDYAPGASAMTLVPDDRRTVDRVWIPAWSVTEIRLA